MTALEANDLGLKIRVTHYRHGDWDGAPSSAVFTMNDLREFGRKPSAKGGVTVARVYSPSDQLVSVGIAHVNPKDNYNRKRGRDIAVGRALKHL